MTLSPIRPNPGTPAGFGSGSGSGRATERVLPGQTLARAIEVAAAKRAAGVEELVLACEWADAHPPLAEEPHPGQETGQHPGQHPRAVRRDREVARLVEQRRIAADWLAMVEPETATGYLDSLDSEEVLPDPWLPDYAWDTVASFAAALGLSTTAGGRLIDEALFLRTRMPRLWARLLAGEVEAFRARRIAQTGWRQPADVVDTLDLEVTPRAHTIGVTALDGLVDEITLRLHAETRELDQLTALDQRHVTRHDEVSITGLAETTSRTDLADAIAFDRACSAVAAALLAQQHATGTAPEPLDVRRARALGILADPAFALALLTNPTNTNTDTTSTADAGTASTEQATGTDPAGTNPADDPTAGLDPGRPLAPRMELVVHLTPGLVAGLDGGGAGLSFGQHPTAWVSHTATGSLRAQLTQAVAAWAARPATQVTVQPVIDLTDHQASSSPRVTATMKRRTGHRRTTCAFPHCGRPAAGCDADHRVPTDQGGASCDCNLHPLCRRHHRLKTFTGWTYLTLPPETPPEAGPHDTGPHDTGPPPRYLWIDPHGMVFLVDHHGTRNLTPDGWNGCRFTPPSQSQTAS